MIIQQIELSNWLAFKGKHSLKLDAGAIAVVARYKGDEQRSNWAGKTALLRGIEWALFGTHHKRYDDDVIFRGEDSCAVAVEFDTGATICRARKRGEPTTFAVVPPGWTARALMGDAAASWVVENLGMDLGDFRATLCISQGDTHAIVSRTSGERRKIIAQWLELDAWGRVYARANAQRIEARSELDRLRAERKRAEEMESLYPSRESLLNKSSVAYAEHIDAKASAIALDEQLAVAIREGKAWDAQARVDQLTEELAALKGELQGVQVADVAQAQERATVAKTQRDELSKQLRKVDVLVAGQFDGQCPLTRGECPSKAYVEGSKLEFARQHKRLITEFDQVDSDCTQALGYLKTAREQDQAVQHKRHRFNVLVEELRRQRELAKGVTMERAPDVQAIREQVRAAYIRCEKANADYGNAQQAVLDRERAFKAIGAVEIAIKDSEEHMRIANLAANAVSATGVQADIAEASLGVLEERANAVLLDSGLSFEFGWDRQVKGLADTCTECGYPYRGQREKRCPSCHTMREAKRSDVLEILVNDGSGVVEDVRCKSGGAQILVASAIRLAAGAMLRDLRGSAMAFALVDEPFGSLDTVNRGTLATTFAGMLAHVGLAQALVVSHDVALLDALPGRVTITRDEEAGCSSVVVGHGSGTGTASSREG